MNLWTVVLKRVQDPRSKIQDSRFKIQDSRIKNWVLSLESWFRFKVWSEEARTLQSKCKGTSKIWDLNYFLKLTSPEIKSVLCFLLNFHFEREKYLLWKKQSHKKLPSFKNGGEPFKSY
jgi:hypothetical protein